MPDSLLQPGRAGRGGAERLQPGLSDDNRTSLTTTLTAYGSLMRAFGLITTGGELEVQFSPGFHCNRKAARMSNFSDWQDRMLRAVWRYGEQLPEGAVTWASDLYGELGEVSETEFCESWTARTFSMARSAFEVVVRSAEEDTGKAATGDNFCYIDYLHDPDLGPVGVVRIKSAEVSTPDWAEVLGAVAEGVQEFIMSHHRVTWPICGDHGRGLHVGYFHETAVWKCAGGDAEGHVVKAIDPAVHL